MLMEPDHVPLGALSATFSFKLTVLAVVLSGYVVISAKQCLAASTKDA